MFTKHLDEITNLHHTIELGFKVTDARLEDAPQLYNLSTSMDEYQKNGNGHDWKWLKLLSGGRLTNNENPSNMIGTCDNGVDDENVGNTNKRMANSRRTQQLLLAEHGNARTQLGRLAASALGVQTAGTRVQRLECRPPQLPSGFDLNFPI